MHVLANQHYLRKPKRGKKERPAWLQRLDKSPAHWSGPAARYQEGWTRLHFDMAHAIRTAPAPLREILSSLQGEVLQLRRMVSQGVIRGMVLDEFWKQYAQVPINVETAVKITNRLVEELGRHDIRALVNDAVAPKEAKREVA